MQYLNGLSELCMQENIIFLDFQTMVCTFTYFGYKRPPTFHIAK